MEIQIDEADLFLFMGQSNMAGRGITSERWTEKAPGALPGAGYEFRAISDPERLYPLEEPFGQKENLPGGINDVFGGGVLAKTGSMTVSFCNACYRETGVPIVGVSASKGGSHIAQWQPDSAERYLPDALARYRRALAFLDSHGIPVRHRFMVWCQGESDGDRGTGASEYRELFGRTLREMRSAGIEHCFLIKIGNCNLPGQEGRYRTIQLAQEEIARECPDVTMVSRAFEGMQQRGLMKDAFHYYQQAYNECGEDAGKRAGELIRAMDAGGFAGYSHS